MERKLLWDMRFGFQITKLDAYLLQNAHDMLWSSSEVRHFPNKVSRREVKMVLESESVVDVHWIHCKRGLRAADKQPCAPRARDYPAT